MIRATFKNGVIQPIDPPPSDWREGMELVVNEAEYVDEAEDLPLEDLDKWHQNLEAMVAKLDPNDIERMELTIRQADEEAKAWVRREMGLGE